MAAKICVSEKVKAALAQDLTPVICVGESKKTREQGKHLDFIATQFAASVPSDVKFDKLVIAYEPIWAIGTGVTASTDQAQEIHAFIRNLLSKQYGEEVAEDTSILYGGYCMRRNEKELFARKDIDGGLIGGASLNAADFVAITQAF